MPHDMFTMEDNGKMSGGLNNFEHNCTHSLYTIFLSGQRKSYLYWTDFDRADIFKMTPCGGPLIPMNVSSQARMKHPDGLAHDTTGNMLYWADAADGNKMIGRVSLLDGQVDTMPLTSGKNIFSFTYLCAFKQTYYKFTRCLTHSTLNCPLGAMSACKQAPNQRFSPHHLTGYIFWLHWLNLTLLYSLKTIDGGT